MDATWISYNYYNGTKTSDYMKYKDVEYNGEKYRAVTFTSYRPHLIGEAASASNSYQDDNDYNINTVYWFKYEPIKWKVIDPENGLVLCKSIIDSQEFHNKYINGTQIRDGEECYANSYKHSSIRKFLTDTFYNLAFNSVEKELIVPTTISSNDYTTDYSTGNGDITDSVFLLSYNEMINKNYGFSSLNGAYDKARMKLGTDYAKSQGLNASIDDAYYYGNSPWWLRSAGRSDNQACVVYNTGYVATNCSATGTYNGICPALYLNLESQRVACLKGEHTMGEGTITKKATCIETGIKTYTCKVCGYETTEEISTLGVEHSFENNYCTNCGYYKLQLTQDEIIELGSYPQTKVTDEDLISVLNSIDAEWISYDYYIENVQSDYMKYKDVEYSGEKYRAVTFTSYRPYYTGHSSSTSHSYQDENGYNTNTVYWFKYEPIKWKVLDPKNGLVLCESIIDSQDFYDTYYKGTQTRDGESCYANNYKHSNIRKYLTETFYNLAFSSIEKELIVPTTISSNDYTTSWSTGNGNVTDSVFLLGWNDVLDTSYGFSSSDSSFDTTRRNQGTDYAKSQGLFVITSSSSTYYGNGNWWLRSAGYDDVGACEVANYGAVNCGNTVDATNNGVCPALYLNVDSSSWICLNDGHKLGEETIIKEPTCTEAGIKLYICEVCMSETTEEIPALGHEYENGQCIRCECILDEYSLGDVNKDGKINAADMNYMVKIISGLNEADESTFSIADVSGDGKVTAVDMNLLSKYISGLISSFTIVASVKE